MPVIFLVYGSYFFKFGDPSKSFIEIVFTPLTGKLFINTIIYAVGGAVVATTLAVIYAWIVVRTDIPGKKFFELLPFLPLTMPFIVKSFAWIYLFSPRIGMVNILFKQLFGVGPVFNIFSMEGMIFALGMGGVPLVYLTVEPAIKAMNPALEEASRVSGYSILHTFRRVSLPTLLPAILSAFILLTIIGMENFDYPFMLGRPVGIDTLATEVYYWIYESIPPRYVNAAYLSVIYIGMTFVAVCIYIYVTRQAYKFVVVTGKAPYQTVHRLGKWKCAAFAICFIIIFFVFFLPFGTILLMSFTPFLYLGGGAINITFTLSNYEKALQLPLFYKALTNSILLGLTAGLFASLIALVLSYAALKSKVKGSRFIELISSMPLAFPGIVYGLALFWTFLLFPGVSKLLYGTIWCMVIALIFIRLPYCVRIISGNLIQVADELEESSRVAGASWGRTFFRIILPLLKKGITNSFLYTFINALRELGAIIILATPQSVVLTSLLIQLYSQHAMALNTIAAASVILCLLIMISLLIPSVYEHLLRKYTARKAKKVFMERV
ncbi:MAG: iron ABC transporter permease [Candidatus Bathyarchaeia archaeon]